jgi:hypothetical protein
MENNIENNPDIDSKNISVKEDSILIKYQKEISNDTKVDRINIEEIQLKLPGIKAKWQARLINHKTEIDKLEEIYDEAIEKIAAKIENDANVAISRVLSRKQAESHSLAKKIKKQIKEEVRIVEYLEKIEKTFASMTYDIKNIIDIIKSETM